MQTRLSLRFRGKMEGSGALPSWAELHSSNMSTLPFRILKSAPAHKNKEERVNH